MYEAVLIELNKENAPNILLETFNYFANKTIYQYVNKRYNIYDINQQTTDDLRVIKATAKLTPQRSSDYDDLTTYSGHMANYRAVLPNDYFHILNCICIFELQKTFKCYNKGDFFRASATRLTADAYSQVIENFWNRPTYKRPYYYLHHVNNYQTNPTNTRTDAKSINYLFEENIEINKKELESDSNYYIVYCTIKNTDYYLVNNSNQYLMVPKMHEMEGASFVLRPIENPYSNVLEIQEIQKGEKYNISKYNINIWYDKAQIQYEPKKILSTDGYGNPLAKADGNPPSTISLKTDNDVENFSNVERSAQIRYGNASDVILEIRYGTDDSVFKLVNVYIDYIKTPQHIRLTQQQIDRTEDTSQVLEFPDYVCQEIINELVHTIMENISEQRLQTHPVVSQSIAYPAQQQTEPVAQQQPT